MQARGGPRPAPGTLNKLFFDAISQYNRPDALQVKSAGAYRPISHSEVAGRVRHAARGLQSLGVRRGDRVAILSENRPEWALADYASLTAGLTDVPSLPDSSSRPDRLHPQGLWRGRDLRVRSRPGGEGEGNSRPASRA